MNPTIGDSLERMLNPYYTFHRNSTTTLMLQFLNNPKLLEMIFSACFPFTRKPSDEGCECSRNGVMTKVIRYIRQCTSFVSNFSMIGIDKKN